MIEALLEKQLEPAVKRCRRFRGLFHLAGCWGACAALFAVLWLGFGLFGLRVPSWVSAAGLIVALVLASIVWLRARQWQPDYRQVARQIEQRHPELHAVLLTAVEQTPDPQTGHYTYLQQRVIHEAVAESLANNWIDSVPNRRLVAAHAAHWMALALLLALAVANLFVSPAKHLTVTWGQRVSVSPGNISIERGGPLVVLARFEGQVPAEATLVVQGEKGEQRIPLIKNLEDPTFGGTVPSVEADLTYSVQYGNHETTNFQVNVFDYPRLERADAQIVFPGYTGKPEALIKDTRRISVLEGSTLDWTLHLNKPVVSAQLVAKDKPALSLAISTNEAVAQLNDFILQKSARYHLVLKDNEGRTNKLPAQFVFEALTNRRPEIKLVSPRGDQRLSPLQEISFQAEAWDDFGIKSYGLTYTVAGSEPRSIELGKDIPATEKRSYGHLLKLEHLGLVPDQLVSWFVWVDDTAPDGSVRRTSSDMFFAEIRPFEEIFRQGEGMEMEGGMQGGGGGSESLKLADLQKQIINATWKLERQTTKDASSRYAKDAGVVLESQEEALEQAKTLRARALDPRVQGLWDAVETEMTKAVEELVGATNAPAALLPALSAEQSAYQALLKISSREYLVARNSSPRGGGGGGGEERNQRQLDQLEFKGDDNRYETQRQASPAQSAEQREQLGVLSRLKELAQRQQDLNDRLKELQTALQEAKTEKEREELRRELKRLREEEQEMLASVDDLLQRMSQPQSQSQMADARRELEKTRDEVQRAAEALANESVAQALTSGTRAEREFEQMRDDFRKKNSSQFSEEMRQMRSEARDLARNQQQIAERMKSLAEEKRKTLSDSDETKAIAEQFDKQKTAFTNLLADVQRVNEQAETPEPLLARQLYDALRRANHDDAGRAKDAINELLQRGQLTQSMLERLRQIDKESRAQSLDVSAELLRNNLTSRAQAEEQRARAAIDQLKRGVEKAAESVLGDDTEALRTARSELEQLAQELEKEMAEHLGQAETNGSAAAAMASEAATNGLAAAAGAGTNQLAGARGTATNQAAATGSGQQQASPERPGSQPGQEQAAQNGENPGGQRSVAASGQNGENPSGQNDQNQNQSQTGQNASGNNPGARGQGGPFRLGQQAIREFFNSGGGGGDGGGHNDNFGPLTGEHYYDWSERLGNVEEMVESPELRSEISRIRDRARAMRSEFKRHAQSPQWPLVQTQIITPLNEVRNRVAEELARRESTEALVPIDRDPVPNRFSELVRRYYEKLGQE